MMATKAHDLLDVYSEEYRRRGFSIRSARFDAATGNIFVTLRTGVTFSFAKDRVQTLANATNEQLSEIEVSPAGWSIDFPALDDGIPLEAILAGRFGNDRWEQEWAGRQLEDRAA